MLNVDEITQAHHNCSVGSCSLSATMKAMPHVLFPIRSTKSVAFPSDALQESQRTPPSCSLLSRERKLRNLFEMRFQGATGHRSIMYHTYPEHQLR